MHRYSIRVGLAAIAAILVVHFVADTFLVALPHYADLTTVFRTVSSVAIIVVALGIVFFEMWRPYAGGRMMLLAKIDSRSGDFSFTAYMEQFDHIERSAGKQLPRSTRRSVCDDMAWLRRKRFVADTNDHKLFTTDAGREALARFRASDHTLAV